MKPKQHARATALILLTLATFHHLTTSTHSSREIVNRQEIRACKYANQCTDRAVEVLTQNR